jgi:hypothetical protein
MAETGDRPKYKPPPDAEQNWVVRPAPKTWDELVEGVTAFFTERWKTPDGRMRACAYCGNRDWQLGQVLGLPASERWPVPPGQQPASFPFLQVACKMCGQTVLVDVLVIFEPQQSHQS